MIKQLLRIFFFGLTVAAIVVGLKVMNWLPMVLQQGTMRPYASLDLLKSRLQLERVLVPAYLPKQFHWPPSEILAQRSPYTAVIMEFRDEETGEPLLLTSQTDRNKTPLLDRKLRIRKITEQVPYSLKGRKALLTVGECGGGDPCSRITWEEGSYRMDLLMRSGPFELLRVADSMIHE